MSAADPNLVDPGSERLLLRIPKPQSNHNGGQLAFGPDGMLYISTGDGGAGGDVGVGHTPGLGNAQDLSVLLGKILRIDVNAVGDPAAPYAIPADNPFVGVAGAQPEIWAYGLRNPWRFSFDRAEPTRLFAADVGQNLYEEVDLITRGGNYGWHIREGFHCFNPDNPAVAPASCPDVGASGEPLIDPILEFPHADASGPVTLAIIGGYVYRGTALPGLRGTYVFGQWSAGIVMDGRIDTAVAQSDGTWSSQELSLVGFNNGRLGRYVLAFGQDAQGELYVLTSASPGPAGSTGVVYRFVPAP